MGCSTTFRRTLNRWGSLMAVVFFGFNMFLLMRRSVTPSPLRETGLSETIEDVDDELKERFFDLGSISKYNASNSSQQDRDRWTHFRQSVDFLDSLVRRTFIKQTQRLSPPKQAIIVTYMRSGSSFLGDVIHSHPDVFYVFEPLHVMQPLLRFEVNFPLSYLQSGPQNFRRPRKYNNRVYLQPADILSRFLNCDFIGLDTTTLSQDFMKNSSSTESYFRCLRKSPGVLGNLRCLPTLYEACRGKQASLIKTIRVPMALTEGLLATHPTLKIIHLVRDPRATLQSQAKVGEYTREQIRRNLDAESRTFCDKVYKDTQLSKRLLARSPNRIKLVRYESLAGAPLQQTRLLFDFLGLDFTPEVNAHIERLTANRKIKPGRKRCDFCTEKTNSSHASLAWRSSAAYTMIRTIDRNCAKLLDFLGYLPVTSEAHLRNLSSPLMRETFVTG